MCSKTRHVLLGLYLHVIRFRLQIVGGCFRNLICSLLVLNLQN